jgi:CheY-like chemotaxis protein
VIMPAAWLDFDLDLDPAAPGSRWQRSPGVVVGVADPTDRAKLAGHLSDRGFTVWAVQSGAEALTEVVDHAGRVDAVLLDADLSDLPGPAFLRRLRGHFPGLPCVFRGRGPRRLLADLRTAGAEVLPPATPLPDLSDRLWAIVAADGGADA